MQLNTLAEALHSELSDIYDSEQQLVHKLPTVVRAIFTPSLRAAIEVHAEETRDHVARLERIFNLLGQKAKRNSCDSMHGLIQEIDEIIGASGRAAVKDAMLIGALQRVEHYEMAGYGTARAFAEQLGLDDVVELLQESLDEEIFTDRKLTQLAEGGLFSPGVNIQASHVGQPRP